MGGKSQPNYGDIAMTEAENNAQLVNQQLYANRPSQYTPWGAQTWTSEQVKDPGTGEYVTQWSQTTSLTPELQTLLNKELATQGAKADIAGMMTGRLGSEFSNAIDWRGLRPMGKVPTNQFTIPEDTANRLDYGDIPGVGLRTTVSAPLQTGLDYGGIAGINREGTSAEDVQRDLSYGGIDQIGDPDQIRQYAEESRFSKSMSRLGPIFESKRAGLEMKLRNQGLRPGDAAWKSQMQGLGMQETDATAQAQYDAVTGGMAEANQMFNQQMGRRGMSTEERNLQAQFFNQAGQQAFQQQYNIADQAFGQQRDIRNIATGERDRKGAFANAASGQQFQQTFAAQQQMFDQEMGLRNMYTGERNTQADFYNQAAQQRFNMASSANAQNYSQQMQSAAFANQMRQQEITEAMTVRGFNLNEINALMSGGQVGLPSMPNFSQAGISQGPQLLTAAAQTQSGENAASPWGGLTSLAGTLGGAYLGTL